MSSPIARLVAFAALLAVVLGGGALLGGAIDPSGSAADDGGRGERSTAAMDGAHGDAAGRPDPQEAHGDAAGGHRAQEAHAAPTAAAAPAADAALPGLQSAQDGYRLVVARDRYDAAARVPLRFRVVDGDGRPVTDFDVEHEKRLHLIVVRRDLSGFQHLHPRMRADGTWAADADLSAGGTWRLFADFTRDGVQRTLGSDVQVDGRFQPAAATPPRTRARSDGGLDVALRPSPAAPRAGAEQRLAFEVRDGGRRVDAELEPYLGAGGHLVALREGDLAYLHVHPDGDRLAFATSWPSAGRYRLYVQFKHHGRVHTATFGQEVPR